MDNTFVDQEKDAENCPEEYDVWKEFQKRLQEEEDASWPPEIFDIEYMMDE